MFWIILLVVIAILAFCGFLLQKKQAKKEENVKNKSKEQGINIDEMVSVSSYVGGHPDVNDVINNLHANKENGTIVFYRRPVMEMPVRKFSIDSNCVKNISVEDSTSIDNRVTVGRLLLVGIFAFAWKKKKKNELAFVIIDWNDGKFDHSTTFSFEGKDAMVKANTARNGLIKLC